MNSAELLDRLVGFPTVSRDPNWALIEFVREFLGGCGVSARLYVDQAVGKANLYACIGPADCGGVLLSGHTDVVPVDGQRWSSDPFRLQQRGARLFGRGTADMKGFLACTLRAAQRAASRSLRMPLQLAFSYDEEIGCVGVRSLIEAMAGWSHRPKFCIVGEPTLLSTAIGQKGKVALSARCQGRAAHSANPQRGINAIYMAAELIERIRQRQQDVAHQSVHDPAYALPHTSLHVGIIKGGSVLNIVPAACEIELEIRYLPLEAPEALLAGLRADAAAVAARYPDGAQIDMAVTNEYPGLATAADADVVELVSSLTGEPTPVKVDFGSEAGLFSQRLGIPTVVCGPGSIEQAHKPDEYIAVEQLERCDAMLDALLDRLT